MRLYCSPIAGYIKRTAADTYHRQNRGGRGIAGLSHKDEDFTEELFVGSTHDYMLFMTDKGRVYRLKGYQVPEGGRTSKGTNIVNLLQLQNDEKVTTMMRQPAGIDQENSYITMVTRQGLIKRTPLSQFKNIRKAGLIALTLNEGDALTRCRLTGRQTHDAHHVVALAHGGMARTPRPVRAHWSGRRTRQKRMRHAVAGGYDELIAAVR